MAVRTRIDTIERDVRLAFDELLSPAARGRQLAEGARALLVEADETNRRALGHLPTSRTYVDGVEGRDLDTVHADGVIVREYDLVADLLKLIAAELWAISPFLSGRYRKNHILFADGQEVPVESAPVDAVEYVFLNPLPYARKIEGFAGRPPQSRMALQGVYEFTALKVDARYSNIARVRFSWRSPLLSYVPGAWNRMQRASLRGQGAKLSAMRMERETRVPAIVVTMR
ncbi:MAG: hypothetical protein WDM91_10915 [Rhizomicrobium sp.]